MGGVEFEVDIPVDGVGDLTRAATGADDLSRSLKQLDKASGGSGMTKAVAGGVALGNVLTAVAEKALAAAAALVRMGLEAAIGFGKAVIEAAAFGEKSELAIKQLIHGGGDAKKELQEIVGIAARMGLPVEETVKSFQKLLAMQFKPAQAKELIKMGADLQAIGASTEEVAGALTAISQIKAKGRVQAEELLQLAERGVSTELILEALGKRLGKTTDQVRSLMQAGKITAEDGIAAIGEAVKKKTGIKQFGEAGEKFANTTLAGMAAQFKARGQALLMDIGSRVLKPLTEAVVPIVKDLFKAMESPEAKATIDGIVGGFTWLAGAVKTAWPVVKEFAAGLIEGLAPLKQVWAGFQAAMEPVLKAFGVDAKDAASGARLFGQGLALIIGAGTIVAAVLTGVVAVFTAIPVAIFRASAAVGEGIVGVVNWLLGLPGRLTGAAASLSTAAMGLGSSIVDGIVSGITAGVGKVVSAVVNLGKSAIGAGKTTLDAHSPSGVFEDIGMSIPQGTERGVWSGVDKVQSATRAVVAPPPVPTVQLGGAGGGRGGNTIAPVLNFNFGGPPPGANPAQAAQQIGDIVEARFTALMERWAIQGGL